MEEKNVNEILEMLKELASNQATIVKCNAKLFALETEDKISECVENARNYLNDKRNEYGVKIEKITTEYENETVNVDRILEKYKKRMGQVVEFFDDELKNVEEKQSNAQIDFISLVANFIPTILKAQGQVKEMDKETKKKLKNVKIDLANGDYKSAVAGIEGIQELKKNNQPEEVKTVAKGVLEQMKNQLTIIQECKEEKANIRERCDNAINTVKFTKNMALSKVQKQNIVQKVLGSIFSKFNGTKKFVKNVVDPLKDTVTEIKDTHIPNVKANIEARMTSFENNLINTKNELANAVAEKVDKYAEQLATKKEEVIRNIHTTKDNISNGIKDGIDTAKIEAMIARDFISDKAETAQIYGLELGDKIKGTIKAGKDWVTDKAETAQIIGMVTKDEIVARKNAIIQGAVNLKNSATEKISDAREGITQMTENVRDGAVQIATNIKNGAVNRIASARDLIIRGATSVKDAGKNTYKAIANMGLQAKMGIITNIQRKLEEQEKQIYQKMAKLNENQQEDIQL